MYSGMSNVMLSSQSWNRIDSEMRWNYECEKFKQKRTADYAINDLSLLFRKKKLFGNRADLLVLQICRL